MGGKYLKRKKREQGDALHTQRSAWTPSTEVKGGHGAKHIKAAGELERVSPDPASKAPAPEGTGHRVSRRPPLCLGLPGKGHATGDSYRSDHCAYSLPGTGREVIRADLTALPGACQEAGHAGRAVLTPMCSS